MVLKSQEKDSTPESSGFKGQASPLLRAAFPVSSSFHVGLWVSDGVETITRWGAGSLGNFFCFFYKTTMRLGASYLTFLNPSLLLVSLCLY